MALKEKKELSIYGNDWPTQDGTCIRDYIHVMDLADAHIAALDFLNKNPPQIVSFNIGTGKGTSVLEIIQKFIEVNLVLLPYKFESRREGDSGWVVADNKLALERLEWFPRRSLEDMCADSLDGQNMHQKLINLKIDNLCSYLPYLSSNLTISSSPTYEPL